jgi:hypothetical protein
MRSTTRELTYPAVGATMEFGACHLHGIGRRASFQKDNDHTESLMSVGRSIATSYGRATSQGGADEKHDAGRLTPRQVFGDRAVTSEREAACVS